MSLKTATREVPSQAPVVRFRMEGRQAGVTDDLRPLAVKSLRADVRLSARAALKLHRNCTTQERRRYRCCRRFRQSKKWGLLRPRHARHWRHFASSATLALPFDRSSTVAATDKVFAGSIPEVYDRFLVPLIFEAYARDWPSGWPGSDRRMSLRRRPEPASSHEPSQRSFRRPRASWRPISTSRCWIAPRRDSLARAGSMAAGGCARLCRSRIEASTSWPASSG